MPAVNYLYIELLRQVCPFNEPFYDFDFFLLGSFDAMSVDGGNSINELKKKYESNHSKVHSVFDRQPVYLYTNEAVDLDNLNIFSTGRYEENSYTPLILTLFQLDKISLANEGKYTSPEELIDGFKNVLQERVKPDHVRFQVFWNLGESDIVVVFRTLYLKEVSTLLHDLREHGLNSEHMFIISTASHCAFPKPSVICKLNVENHKVIPERIIDKNLHAWLYSKDETGSPLYNTDEFVTLGNVTSYDALSEAFSLEEYASFSFLFGEWDYMMNFTDLKQLEKHMKDTFMCLISSNEKLTSLAPFRVSYTIPKFALNLNVTGTNPISRKPVDEQVKRSCHLLKIRIRPQHIQRARMQIKQRIKPQIIQKMHPLMRPIRPKARNTQQNKINYLDRLSESMVIMANHVKSKEQLSEIRGNELADEILSFRNSLYGMGKFLYRLKIGRFEEDLYTYIQPVFVRLKKITDDYTVNFIDQCNDRDFDDADSLIVEYLSDTSKLVENLQHLFSIMAVSPHTYIETYGSNMRSLAAADKLLDSYQGVIEFLKTNFPDTILQSDDGTDPSSREILIFPYRKTQSEHTLLYKKSQPLNRISYISLDFTRMFDLRATIFTILHECGHHLGDRNREERFKHFFSALVCMIICWASGNDYIEKPLEYLVQIINQDDKVSEPNELMVLKGLKDTTKKAIVTYFSREIREIIQVNVAELGKYIDVSNYLCFFDNNKTARDIKYLSDLWTGYYADPILKYLEKAGIPEYFGFDHDEINQHYRDSFQDVFKKNVITMLAEPLRDLAFELADAIDNSNPRIRQDIGITNDQNTGNIREALRIKTLYTDIKQIAEDLINPIENIISSKWVDGSIDSLFTVFSDIYSDLFAIIILDMKYEQYMSIIPKALGIEQINIDAYRTNMMRVYAIATQYYEKNQVPDFIRKNFDASTSKLLAEKWNLLQYAPSMPYMQEYVKCCEKSLKNQLKDADSKDHKSIQQVQNMFSDEGEKQINGIYHFYQYLMKKGNQRP